MSPAFGVGTAGNNFLTFILDFVDRSPSKHTWYVTAPAHGARAVVSPQLGLSTGVWLGDDAKMARLADKSFVWVWTTVRGQVKAVVQREPLSTPNGHIRLWLSDLIEKREDLPDEFVRPIDGG